MLHLNYALPQRGIPAALSFRCWVAVTLAAVGHQQPAELSIRIVDTDEGRFLNHNYRHKDYATNVLSFPADFPVGLNLPLLGDLVICAPVVAHEAVDQGKLPRNHWAHMCVHGVLHLLGHDHTRNDQAKRMEKLERCILARLGIPDPYA